MRGLQAATHAASLVLCVARAGALLRSRTRGIVSRGDFESAYAVRGGATASDDDDAADEEEDEDLVDELTDDDEIGEEFEEATEEDEDEDEDEEDEAEAPADEGDSDGGDGGGGDGDEPADESDEFAEPELKYIGGIERGVVIRLCVMGALTILMNLFLPKPDDVAAAQYKAVQDKLAADQVALAAPKEAAADEPSDAAAGDEAEDEDEEESSDDFFFDSERLEDPLEEKDGNVAL
ncbi:hypothetical protein M885DRAFT_547281 [Pelagophyceae sp. CCMP2097]|nr:hypothetical protein M885DRAFT_547281 [Pelagophyceae sp. CCMP2097]